MDQRSLRSKHLNSEEIAAVLEEIPSDYDSEVSDTESESESGCEVLQEEDVIGIENMDQIELEDRNDDEENDRDDIDGRYTLRWSKDIIVHDTHTYLNNPGPRMAVKKDYPVDYFLSLFDAELIGVIVYQTNLYSTQEQGGSCAYKPTTIEEIKRFLAINLLMGVKRCPSYRDYWSSDPTLRDSYISSLMPRNRFAWLLGHIHLNDNNVQPKKGEDGYDKLFKVRPLLSALAKNFKRFYEPTETLSVDESMIRFKGRSSLKQYMPQKPIKRGYKVWVLANESGYVSKFEIYSGKIGQTTEKCLGARVVKTLTEELAGSYRQIYFDSFFTSLPLLKHLVEQGIYACGTVRKGRVGLPTDFECEKNMSRGEFQFRCSEEKITAMFWKDRKGILFLSNFHNVEDVCVISRKNKDGSRTDFLGPKLVQDYTKHMGYVDKADMLKSFYEIDRKSKKWWHRIFWHFLDVSVVNAFILYKESTNCQDMNLKNFRLAVIAGLVGANSSETPPRSRNPKQKNQFKPFVAPEKRFDKALHMPQKGTSRRCALCSTAKDPHRTKWMCETCKVGLCMSKIKNCFQEYHSKK